MTFGYLTPGCVTAESAFTPMQRGRMRCFLEYTYPNWFVSSVPTVDPSESLPSPSKAPLSAAMFIIGIAVIISVVLCMVVTCSVTLARFWPKLYVGAVATHVDDHDIKETLMLQAQSYDYAPVGRDAVSGVEEEEA